MAPRSSYPSISVIVPTYEESLNIRPLCTRLFKATSANGIDLELLIIDDFSGKDSEKTKMEVAKLNDDPKMSGKIKLTIRLPEEGKGLSSAVLIGLRKASNDVLVVMDADLQHEPESVPKLVQPILATNSQVDFVFGSRNVGGGEYDNMPLIRRIISFGATFLAKGLTKQTDPMSGFFSLRRSVLRKAEGNGLNPLGYKIGLELLVRSKVELTPGKVLDVPITFRDRTAGESKLSAKQYILYLLHLLRLYWFLYPFLCTAILCSGTILVAATIHIMVQFIN